MDNIRIGEETWNKIKFQTGLRQNNFLSRSENKKFKTIFLNISPFFNYAPKKRMFQLICQIACAKKEKKNISRRGNC